MGEGDRDEERATDGGVFTVHYADVVHDSYRIRSEGKEVYPARPMFSFAFLQLIMTLTLLIMYHNLFVNFFMIVQVD